MLHLPCINKVQKKYNKKDMILDSKVGVVDPLFSIGSEQDADKLDILQNYKIFDHLIPIRQLFTFVHHQRIILT